MWYKSQQAQKLFSFFFNATSFAGAFGGFLASAVGKMEGIRNYHAWRWVFILEGILACVLSVFAFFVVADFPETAKWLDNHERKFTIGRLAADEGKSKIEDSITWQGVLGTFKDWKMIPGALMYFGPTVSAYGTKHSNLQLLSPDSNQNRIGILHPIHYRHIRLQPHPGTTAFSDSMGSRHCLRHGYCISLWPIPSSIRIHLDWAVSLLQETSFFSRCTRIVKQRLQDWYCTPWA